MKVVILCGGQGTRLREETEFRPKPMVEIGGRPILWHIMKSYAHYGFREFVLCLGYRGNMIKDYFLNYEAMNSDCTVSLGSAKSIRYHNNHEERDFQVTLADTGAESMTGGRLKRVGKYIDGDEFLLTYGDGLADVNIENLVTFHRSRGRLATVTAVRPNSRFGLMDLTEGVEVRSFSEKPVLEGWASAGYFVLNRKVLDYIPGDSCSFENEPMVQLASEGQLVAYQHDGFFFAMDTYREFKYLNDLWSEGKAPWRVWP
jgi:glucose-1-phosphate cytidylyltransferase